MSATVLRVPADGPLLDGEAAAIDLLGDAFGAQAGVVVVPVDRLSPDFFRLSTGVAGAVTQKFVQYHTRLVVVGPIPDPSAAVTDWVREANRGRDLWFVADDAELEQRLA